MSFNNGAFQVFLYTLLQENQLEQAITACEEKLNAIPLTPFHKIIGNDLLKSKKSLATWLINFHLETISKLRRIETIYCEMNGFSINPNHWYVTGVAFKKMIDYQKDSWKRVRCEEYDKDFTVTGFEDLQDVFAFACNDDSFRNENNEAKFYCEHLITDVTRYL